MSFNPISLCLFQLNSMRERVGGEVVGGKEVGEGVEGRVGTRHEPWASKKHMDLIVRYVWAVRACALVERPVGDSWDSGAGEDVVAMGGQV